MTNQSIQIYVACLAAYNNGHLHGKWIEANQPAWAIYDDIRYVLDTSSIADAEEWAIHDYEGFGGLSISEYEGIERVSELASFIDEHGELGAELLSHFDSIEEAEEALDEGYHGSFASLADYVQELTEDCAFIPEHLRFYIDWEAMARDAEMSGDIFTVQTAHDEIHVFAGV